MWKAQNDEKNSGFSMWLREGCSLSSLFGRKEEEDV